LISKNNVNYYRLLLFLISLMLANANVGTSWSQCPTAPTVNTISQPNCYNNYGVVSVSGLPTGNWTLYATPVAGCGGVPVTISGTGSTSPMTGLTTGCGYTFHYIQASPACTSNNSSIVNVSALPTPPSTPIVLNINQPNCPPGFTTGCVTLGNLPFSGSWFITATGPSTFTTSNQLGASYTICGLAVGTWTFTVTRVIDSCLSAAVQVNILNPTSPASPVVQQVVQPTCASNVGSVSLNGLPSGMPWVLTATPSAGLPNNGNFNGSGTSATFPNLIPNATYQFTVTDTNGCVSLLSTSASITSALSIPPVPSATAVQPTCPAPNASLTFTSPLGINYFYSINGTNFQSSTSFSPVPGGNYTLFVQDTSSGCITTSASPFTINPTPQPPAISTPVVNDVTCFGVNNGWAVGQVDSLGTPPFVYSWSPVAIANDTATNLAPGNYNFVVVDALQCVVIQSVTINQPTVMTIVGDSTPVNCATGQLGTMDVTVTGGSGPYTYVWSPGGQATDSIFNLNVGNYSVQVSDTNGCIVTFGATIGIVNDLPVAIVPGDTVVNPSSTFVASVAVGTTFLWTPNDGLSCDDCQNPIVTPDTTTEYFVFVSDNNGCTGVDSMLVTVKLLCGEFFVPTIFSPNGIGPDANNKLKVFGKEGCIKDFSFVIYDRWGQKVFESVNINDAWDGLYKGRPAQEGNFVYDLSLQLYDDSIIRKSGSLTLVR